ncbi:Resolvase, N terminal domain [Rhizobiales bacterium GAS113]|nr:Resolvase, N terminal domain [Rhizobiales bacterium GAS113]
MRLAQPSKYVAYYRVSTAKQGASGLGLDAQKKAVADYIAARGGKLAAEFEEIESGKRSDRPKLDEALAECHMRHAILIVAKLDRLTRNTEFLMKLKSDQADIVFCDLPDVPPGPVGKFFLTQMVAVAELEAGLISQRTKDAFRQVRAKLNKGGHCKPSKKHPEGRDRLGNPENLGNGDLGRANSRESRMRKADQHAATFKPFIAKLQAKGITSYGAIARELMAEDMATSRQKSNWTPMQAWRLVRRIERMKEAA